MHSLHSLTLPGFFYYLGITRSLSLSYFFFVFCLCFCLSLSVNACLSVDEGGLLLCVAALNANYSLLTWSSDMLMLLYRQRVGGRMDSRAGGWADGEQVDGRLVGGRQDARAGGRARGWTDGRADERAGERAGERARR